MHYIAGDLQIGFPKKGDVIDVIDRDPFLEQALGNGIGGVFPGMLPLQWQNGSLRPWSKNKMPHANTRLNQEYTCCVKITMLIR